MVLWLSSPGLDSADPGFDLAFILYSAVMLAKLLNISETQFTWLWNDGEDCFKN